VDAIVEILVFSFKMLNLAKQWRRLLSARAGHIIIFSGVANSGVRTLVL